MGKICEFKMILPDRLDSLQEFTGVAMPILKQIEAYLASNSNSDSLKEVFLKKIQQF